MKNIAAFSLCLFCVLILSCKKDWVDPKHAPNGTITSIQYFCGIDKVYKEDSSHYDKYIYNKEYRIDTIKIYEGNALTGFTKFNYNYNKQLNLVQYYKGGILDSYINVYYRSSNQALLRYGFYTKVNDSLQLTRTVEFKYFDNGRLEKNKFYALNSNNLLEEKYETHYTYDDWGRVIRAEEFTTQDTSLHLSATISYEHSNIENPISGFNVSPIITNGQFSGTITKETKTDINEKVIYSIINDYQAEKNGRITSKTRTFTSDTASNTIKEFYAYRCVPM